MLLIRFHVWFGPSRNREASLGEMKSEIKEEAYATRLRLPDAIRRIRAYEEAFKGRYGAAVATEFTLLGVEQCEDLDDDILDIARVRLIETMPTAPDQFS